MSNASAGAPEPQWQQPPFRSEPAAAPEPVEAPASSGAVIVPRTRVAAPSVTETFLGTVSGLVWPVMIVLAIMGVVSWWPAILVAIVVSTVLGNVSGHLKARRRALARGQVNGGPRQRLR